MEGQKKKKCLSIDEQKAHLLRVIPCHLRLSPNVRNAPQSNLLSSRSVPDQHSNIETKLRGLPPLEAAMYAVPCVSCMCVYM